MLRRGGLLVTREIVPRRVGGAMVNNYPEAWPWTTNTPLQGAFVPDIGVGETGLEPVTFRV